jgi:amidase
MSSDSLPTKYSSRRSFLRTGVAATLAPAAYPALASARVIDPATASASLTGDFAKDFELDEITIDDAQKGIRSGQYSSHLLTEKYLARIQEIDTTGPMLNSVIELNPDALQIADALDRERKLKARADRFTAFLCSSRTTSIPGIA